MHLLTRSKRVSPKAIHRFFIGLTAGTTVTGAYDPVKACSEIAKAHDIWLHIDGAWGGPILFSEQHRSLLADSHLADSFAWDAHKLMNVPITAAVILVKHQGALKACCSGGGGDYLFHADENADYNLGETLHPVWPSCRCAEGMAELESDWQ